jgi:hypothetical protein
VNLDTASPQWKFPEGTDHSQGVTQTVSQHLAGAWQVVEANNEANKGQTDLLKEEQRHPCHKTQFRASCNKCLTPGHDQDMAR